jgi:hypothetical protein
MFKIKVLSIRPERKKNSWILQIHATQHPIHVYSIENRLEFFLIIQSIEQFINRFWMRGKKTN